MECVQCTKHGREFPVELSLALICLSSGEYVTVVERDITERKRAQEALEQAKNQAAMEASKLRSMIEGMEEGVVFADESATVTEVNDWFLDVVRIPREMVVGAKLWDIHPEKVREKVRSIVEDFRRGRRSEKIIVNRKLMGHEVTLRIQPIFHDGEYKGIILNVIDIGDVVEDRKKAEEMDRFRGEYLSRMAVEMRTPLDGIGEMTKLLLDTNLNDEQRALIESVNDCAISLNSLVSDIQDASKIKERKLDIELSAFDLGSR
ncbi:MAG: PAS domain S-box protein, partial [bacterium]